MSVYEVIVPKDEYKRWQCYRDNMVEPFIFNDWVVDRYPEVLSAKWVNIHDSEDYTRIFTFESAELYHWFLLRQ